MMKTQVKIHQIGLALLMLIVTSLPLPALAWPEFQAYSQKNSGRGVSCAMCHVNSDGPAGAGFGQIGSLDAEGKAQLNEARSAFEPGQKVNSPILNAFGNLVVEELGKKKILELKNNPAELATALDQKSDLDEDGIPNAREYAEGTNPLSKASGNPLLLAVHNFKKHFLTVIMITMATFFTLYGLSNLMKAIEIRNRDDDDLVYEGTPFDPLSVRTKDEKKQTSADQSSQNTENNPERHL